MGSISSEKIMKMNYLSWESRRLTTKIFFESGQGGHFGGAFSSAEILTVLYNGILNIDPEKPNWKNRDHFILSKGHIAGIYATVLAIKGFFKIEKLNEYDQLNSAFGMHTTRKIPGCEFATGSLGHGLGVGVGLAIAKKIDRVNSRVFVLIGDGEINEGSVWEAIMSANKFQLDNLITIIDRNMLSMEGFTEETMPLEPLEEKWRSFGWEVAIVDGHNVQNLYNVLNKVPFKRGKPSCIIANTIKGKGLAFKEGVYENHYMSMDKEQHNLCIKNITREMIKYRAMKKGKNLHENNR